MSLYDIDKFDPQPDPDLVCCICQCVLYKAVESPCRHVFCQACIERWLSKRHTCPTCRKRTKKLDLKPVLPLVQNMLNRLLMKCDFYNNGCIQKIMLEHYEGHIKHCGYEMKTCRFIKCGQKILKMHLECHENEDCEHRESVCEGECGLMIALSDKPNHNCVSALKIHIEEKNKMIETLKAKLQELNNLSQTLNEQLEQLRQQLDENRPGYFSPLLSSSSDSVVSAIVDDSLREVSMDIDSSVSNDTPSINSIDINSTDDNFDRDERMEAIDVVQQVERTVVTSLIDLSSRLERVRNQMRSVLDRGVMDEDNNLNDDLRIPSDALNAIVNNRPNASRPTRNDNWNVTSDEEDTLEMNSDASTISRVRSPNEGIDSDHQAATEYSPVSIDSNSSVSEGDWEANAASRNQTDPPTSTAESPHTHYDLDYMERAMSTQSWVHSVGRSPLHSVESQPPRSPSDAGSSYSSIPSMSSVHSVNSGENHDVRQPYIHSNSPGSISSNSSSSPFHWNSSPRLCSPNRTPSHKNYNSNADHSKLSSRGSLSSRSSDLGTPQGSSYGRQSDNDSESSTKSTISKRNSDLNNSLYSNEGCRESENGTTSMNKHSQSGSSDGGESGPLDERNSSPFNYQSDDSSLNDDRINTTNRHPIEISDEEFSSNNCQPDDTKHSLERESSSENNSDESNTSDSGEHSENDKHRRTWKYETKTPNYKCQSSTGRSRPTATIQMEQNDKEIKSNKQNVLMLPVCPLTGGQSDPQSTWTDSFDMKGQKHYTEHGKNSARFNDANETKTKQTKMLPNALDANSPHRSERKDFESEILDCKTENPDTVENVNDNNRKNLDSRKRKYDKSHEVTDAVKRPRQGTATYSGASSGYSSLNSKQSSPRAESSQSSRKLRSSIAASSNTQNHEKGTQSLNVKIDLSLINYTGDILSQPVVTKSISATDSTLIHTSSSGASQTCGVAGALRTPWSSLFRSSDLPLCEPIRRRRTNHRKARETQNSRNAGAGNETHSSDLSGHRAFPNLWCDDSDSASDKTWTPDAGNEETDVSLSDEGDVESETDYEVKVPKSTYDLIQEYASDDTDESWTYCPDSVD